MLLRRFLLIMLLHHHMHFLCKSEILAALGNGFVKLSSQHVIAFVLWEIKFCSTSQLTQVAKFPDICKIASGYLRLKQV